MRFRIECWAGFVIGKVYFAFRVEARIVFVQSLQSIFVFRLPWNFHFACLKLLTMKGQSPGMGGNIASVVYPSTPRFRERQTGERLARIMKERKF